MSSDELNKNLEKVIRRIGDLDSFGIGIDVQLISEINVDNPNFIERNFTAAEIAYCTQAPDAAASFAGRWAAKEAVVKAMMNFFPEGKNLTKGGGAALVEIEVLPSVSGAPQVALHGYAAEAAAKLNISQIKISLSHSGKYAFAAAMVR